MIGNSFADSHDRVVSKLSGADLASRRADGNRDRIGSAVGGGDNEDAFIGMITHVVQDVGDLLAGHKSLSGSRRTPQNTPCVLPPIAEFWQANVSRLFDLGMYVPGGRFQPLWYGGPERLESGLVVDGIQRR